MRAMLFAILIVAGCSISNTVDPVVTAQPYIGLQERQDRAELRKLTGVDPVRTEWCAAFVNAVLEIDGIPGSSSVSATPLMARSFLSWGDRVAKADVRRGDVVVFPRGKAGWQGHVGFYVETRIKNGREYWVILGGNQANQVRYELFEARRAIDVRRWPELTPTQVQYRVLSN